MNKMADESYLTPTELREAVAIDRLIHEPARLVISAVLYAVDSADFLYLLRETGLSKGNLSSHLAKLEGAGYIQIEKTFVGKIPRTVCRMTDQGRAAFADYRERLRKAALNLPE
jgi:DNA-binding MarR family transcriptional regulator